MFRGVNPDLAKILAGLLGMRSGIEFDPETGKYRPRQEFDASDPFAPIEDRIIEVEKQVEKGEPSRLDSLFALRDSAVLA